MLMAVGCPTPDGGPAAYSLCFHAAKVTTKSMPSGHHPQRSAVQNVSSLSKSTTHWANWLMVLTPMPSSRLRAATA